jgi:cytochrome c oxidase subunit 4
MDQDQHVQPVGLYLRAFAGLLVLLACTQLAAQARLGAGLGSLVALAIAGAKAVLVVLYFMHARFGTRVVQVWAATGFAWLLILFGITLADYVARSWVVVPGW